MKAYLLMIGTELLNGMMTDTNSVDIAEELNKVGIEIRGKSIVADSISDIKDAIVYAKSKADLVIISGGLGPTIDDITREGVAEYLDKDLVLYKEELSKIEAKFRTNGIEMPERNKRQAMFPENTIIIENEKGSAPAFLVDDIAVFPGVPSELKSSLKEFILYYSKEKKLKKTIYIKDLLFWGIAESELERRIIDIIEKESRVTVEFLVKSFGIIVRFLTDFGEEKRVEEIKNKIYTRVGKYIYGEDNDRIWELLRDELEKKSYTISTAESCTGGMVAEILTSVSGISEYYMEGFVTYSNASKSKLLSVDEKLINIKGAVSEEVVYEMLKALTTDTGIAISGVAGPSGGTEEKPVGTVFIGVKIKENYSVKRYKFRGDRAKVRYKASLTALNDLLIKLK